VIGEATCHQIVVSCKSELQRFPMAAIGGRNGCNECAIAASFGDILRLTIFRRIQPVFLHDGGALRTIFARCAPPS
jgi:hypothetical protein